MHLQSDKSPRLDEIKTQFRAREGYYRLINSPDYSQRSQRALGFSSDTASTNNSSAAHDKTCIKISLVTIDKNDRNTIRPNRRSKVGRDIKVCFNVGRDIFVYNYDGVRTGLDASHPIYKRTYFGSSPTCHVFNHTTATSEALRLLVGFTHAQIHLIQLNGSKDQESCKEFNVDGLIDKTRVTCIKWLPNTHSLFLVAHSSGNLYLYKDDLPCGPTAPSFQIFKQSDGVTIYTCRTKTPRNPIYKWSIGNHKVETNSSTNSSMSSSSLNKFDNENLSLNEFVFSPCAKYIACVSQDGLLRVFCYDTMDLVGRARSYYGGLTCVCWSPDGKFIVTGGEDDLITVWSFIERRVVARCIGHKSWVSVVSFDSFYTGHYPTDNDVDNYDDDDEDDKECCDIEDNNIEDDDDDDENDNDEDISRINPRATESRSPSSRSNNMFNNSVQSNPSLMSKIQKPPLTSTTYRFGSVGQDTQLCFWDLSDDLLQQPLSKSKLKDTHKSASNNSYHDVRIGLDNDVTNLTPSNSRESGQDDNKNIDSELKTLPVSSTTKSSSGLSKTFSLVGKRDRRSLTLKNLDRLTTSKNYSNVSNNDRMSEDPVKLLGSPICPKMNKTPLIEPTICKKISFERLTSLNFCRGGFITSSQDGFLFFWARPSKKTMKSSSGQSIEELRVIDMGTSSEV